MDKEYIKYICEYPIPIENEEGRDYTLSSIDKASYIHDVLIRLGYKVEIVSPSTSKRLAFSRKDNINKNIYVVSGFSLPSRGRFGSIISRVSVSLWLLFYLVFHTKRGETIIVYHSVFKIPILLLAKKIKKLRYVLEVEEVFSSLQNENDSWRRKLEMKMIKLSESYIFASERLERDYNTQHKSFCIAYGSYFQPPVLTGKFSDGRIHLVYAGLIEKDNTAFKSLRIAEYLDGNYHIHILGYGNENDIALLLNELNRISKITDCYVNYEGTKRNEDYYAFLQSCHIGLCPLKVDKTFQNACFPSKISSYLVNGLIVVASENDVLRESKYADYLYFSQDDNPESFATVIRSIDICKAKNIRDCVTELDNSFERNLGMILNNE